MKQVTCDDSIAEKQTFLFTTFVFVIIEVLLEFTRYSLIILQSFIVQYIAFLHLFRLLFTHFCRKEYIICASIFNSELTLPGLVTEYPVVGTGYPDSVVLYFLFLKFMLVYMAALCNRAGHIYFHHVVSSCFLLFSLPNLNGRRLDVYHPHTVWP